MGALTISSLNKKDASEQYVTQIINFIKGTNTSLPVKKAIGEQLANIIAKVANNNARKLIHTTMIKDIALSTSSQQRHIWLLFLEHLLPQISTRHFKQVYSEAFLAFKDEQVQQMLILYVKLFPLARMRVSDSKLADRLEQTLRNILSKYSKKLKTETLISTINEVTAYIKSKEFIDALNKFFDEDEHAIVTKEIEISNAEIEEQKYPTVSINGLKKPQAKGRNLANNVTLMPNNQKLLAIPVSAN